MPSKIFLPIVVVLLIAGAVGGLVYLSQGGATASGISVDDLLAGKAGKQRVKLQLEVTNLISKDKVIEFDANGIPPEGEAAPASPSTIRVIYSGKDHLAVENWSHVSVTGQWDESAKIFHATDMATQCPSRYENQALPKRQPNAQRSSTTLP